MKKIKLYNKKKQKTEKHEPIISGYGQNDELLKYAIDFINAKNIEESRGLMFLKSGDVIKVKKNFVMLFSIWERYVSIMLEDDEEVKFNELKSVHNGVVSNGDFMVDLDDVAMMMIHKGDDFTLLEYPKFS